MALTVQKAATAVRREANEVRRDAVATHMAQSSPAAREPRYGFSEQLQVMRDNSPRYNFLWQANGRPRSWPLPKPYFSGGASSERYIVSTGSIPATSVTIPAGQAGLIWLDPFSAKPVRMAWTTAGTGFPNFSLTYNHVTAVTDGTITSAGASTATWAYENPFALVGDPNAYVGGLVGQNAYGNDPVRAPDSESQYLGGELVVEAAVPYTSQCIALPFSSFTTPDSCGMATPKFKYPYVATTNQTLSGQRHELIGHANGFRSQAALNAVPHNFAGQFNTPTIMMGGSPSAHRVFTVPSPGDDAWYRPGYLTSVQSADGTAGSASVNMMPRDTFQARLKFGYVSFDNTAGSGAITVIVRYSGTFAHLIRPSEAGNVPVLASILHTSAESLREWHPPDDVGQLSLPIGVGDTHESARSDALLQPSVLPRIKNSVAHPITHGTAVAVGGRYVASQTPQSTGLLDKVGLFFERGASKALQVAGDLALSKFGKWAERTAVSLL